MATDKVTIGVTGNGKNALETLIRLGWFQLEMDAARFALGYAIAKKTAAGEAKGANTVWNVGSIDSDGSVAAVLGELYNERVAPYKLAEFLIDEGLKLMIERLNNNRELTLAEMMMP